MKPMSIEQCYASLPDKLLLAYDDATGCADTDDPADWAAIIPCVLMRKDRSTVQLIIPTPLDPAMMIDRHCVVIGRNSTRRRSGTVYEVDLLGSSSLVTVRVVS
jgi:hypothetical protein